MRKIGLLLLFTSILAKAQNYSLLPKEGTSYFSDAWEVYILKVDSVKKVGNATRYFPMRQPFVDPNKGGHCPDPTISWITDSTQVIIVDSIGNTNVRGLLLKPSAGLGQKWEAGTIGGTRILATVSNWGLKSFLGITDSVKTFCLQAVSPSGDSLVHVFNQLFYEISKQHGLISTRMVGLSQSQGVLHPSSQGLGNTLSISGLEKEGIGFKVHTNEEIFAYEVGDEFHLIDEVDKGGVYPIVDRDSIIQVVIRKRIDSAEMQYTFARQVRHVHYEIVPANGSSSYYQDTVVETYPLDEPYKKQINKVLKYGESQEMMQYYDLQKAGDSIVYRYIQNEGQCVWIEMSYPKIIRYVQGLVGTYYQQYGQGPSAHSSRELIYYKKGTEEWGRPLVLGLAETEASSYLSTTVSPNPSKGKVNIHFQEAPNQSTFELLDREGRKIFESPIDSQKELDISFVNSGFYFYKVTTAYGKYGSGKLLISK